MIFLILFNSVFSDSLSVLYNDGEYVIENKISNDDSCILNVNYDLSLNSSGWDKIEFIPVGFPSLFTVSYAMGIAEGYIFADEIESFFTNIISHFESISPGNTIDHRIFTFLQDNQRFVESELFQVDNVYDNYYIHLNSSFQQYKGLCFGYEKSVKKKSKLTDDDLWFLQALSDIESLIHKYSLSSSVTLPFVPNDHCSLLVTLTTNNKELFFGHNTWYDYGAMIRIHKRYHFTNTVHDISSSEKSEPSKNAFISVTSYPGIITSIEHFFVLSNKFVIGKTSLSIFNESLLAESNGNNPNRFSNNNINRKLSPQKIAVGKEEKEGKENGEKIIRNENRNVSKNEKSLAADACPVDVTESSITVKGILGWMRVFTASLLAVRGQYSTDPLASFSCDLTRHNTGTTVSSYLVLDYSRFKPKQNKFFLDKEAVYLVEVYPGGRQIKDMTDQLISKRYLALFNVPVTDEAFDILGYQDYIDNGADSTSSSSYKFTNSSSSSSSLASSSSSLPSLQSLPSSSSSAERAFFFSRTVSARALLFSKMHAKVYDVSAMKFTMRYNDYRADLESKVPDREGGLVGKGLSDACSSIAARCDLRPDTDRGSGDDLLTRNMRGAIDAKFTSSFLMDRDNFLSISGVTTSHQISLFQRSSASVVSHFPFLSTDNVPSQCFSNKFSWTQFLWNSGPVEPVDYFLIGCGIAAGGVVILSIVVFFLLVCLCRRQKEQQKQEIFNYLLSDSNESYSQVS